MIDIFSKKNYGKKNKNIERYYWEAIKELYIRVLMMLIDDTTKNEIMNLSNEIKNLLAFLFLYFFHKTL